MKCSSWYFGLTILGAAAGLVSTAPARCTLPLDEGKCLKFQSRFRFNPDHDRCEGFEYGGCGGNSNNFKSAGECQEICGGGEPVPSPHCWRERCLNIPYMAVSGCTPSYDHSDSCCPDSFTCAPLPASDPELCMYKDKKYPLGAEVAVKDPCSRCECGPGQNGPQLKCVNAECNTLRSYGSKVCRSLYKIDECCPYSNDCSAPTDVLTRTDVVTCPGEERMYREGDEMYFKDDKCQRCVCGANFTGPFGKGCATIDCGYDTRYVFELRRGCVPLFVVDRCCPLRFICPGDKEVADHQSEILTNAAKRDVCTFGAITLARGASLAMTDKSIWCSCITPPSITCNQNQATGFFEAMLYN